MVRNTCSTVAALLAAASLAGAVSSAQAAPIYFTDWTSATVGNSSSAAGVINTPDGPVTVTYTGQVHSPTQTSCGAAYWSSNPSIYQSAIAENGPSQNPTTLAQNPDSQRCDMISMTGGDGIGVSTFSFDRAILNPILSVLSLGQGGIQAQLVFDQPFTILSQGSGYFGGSASALVDGGPNARGGDTLLGNEGHGTIMFTGSFQTLTWTMPVYENWYGFTIGVQGVAPPPPPQDGVPAPAALLLLGAGLFGMAAMRCR